ncbi:MAG TPA: FecR domain-containing protein [Caldilineae bacterium]|nr:FecR domain-containing protein [Caldilineae bacterium]
MTLVERNSKLAGQSVAKSYENVGRQAWILLWIAFGIFVILLVGIPLTLNWYLRNATEPLPVRVEGIRGTTLVVRSDSEAAIAVIETIDMQEGDTIRTDDTSRANVSIYAPGAPNDSLATIQLRSNSELSLEQAHTPRFSVSDNPDYANFDLHVGRARVTGSADDGATLYITITTPHSTVRLRNGSAAIAVGNDSTVVNARSGEVEVVARGRMVVLNAGRQSTVALGEPPSDPQASSKNLVANGDFSQPLEPTWAIEKVVDAADTSNVTYGEVSIVNSGGRQAAYFVREGEEGIHTETGITQMIDADVLDYDSLILRMDARLINQSLPGGGIQSSEFPLMVRIDFIDVYGKPQFWTYGFYIVDPVANWPIRDGEKIPSFVWYEYESPDFLNSPTFPRPQTVTSIRIYASGHNYRSQASGIELIAR